MMDSYMLLVVRFYFVFTTRAGFSDEMLEFLIISLKDLRKSLKEQGSNLMIRFGNAESIIIELAGEVKATSIYVEEEVEYDLLKMVDILKDGFAKLSSREACCRVETWRAPLYDVENLMDLPGSFHDFKKLKRPILPPLSSSKLPGPVMDLHWGELPMVDDLKNLCKRSGNPRVKWLSVREVSEMEAQQNNAASVAAMASLDKVTENNFFDVMYKSEKRKVIRNTAFVTEKGNFVGGGTDLVLNALAGYLRYLEGTPRDDWQEVHQKLREAESREGASFGALFGPALHIGIISRRRVYSEALKYEKERNGGFLSPFGYSAVTVSASVNTVCSMEWYWILALKDQSSTGGHLTYRIWRWNGHIIHYTVAGNSGPAILLVHGFGAFLEHYRDNINQLAQDGNRVWAITLPGFGKSEKPNIVYTELMWAEVLKDFIVEVVREEVHLVGNSIGGYFISLVAGLWPVLAQSVVLLNTAGNIIPGYSVRPSFKAKKTSVAARLGARLLLLYLRLNIKSIVKSCYPSRPDRADDWLVKEMLRASHDPGGIVLLESIFSFDLSIPLNYLLRGFDGRVLVIQGMKDPLSDSKSKSAMFREHCQGIVIRELDAGHCPHDEQPDEVNYIIHNWILALEDKEEG
ncbi:hypothetical protein Leryth_017416 [Lithospermum erythrorhizon]|nr:hypothetical protein Leryth_017416 [Lithospermum erythrorhizon]